MLDVFQRTDAWKTNQGDGGPTGLSLFQSSVRQLIIDYIISSQIRYSGAGLSARYTLAKKGIQIRSPIHMHARLEALFQMWYNFTDENNWRSNAEENNFDSKFRRNDELPASGDDEIPTRINRFFVGMFYQPLDSIEQYYGEKVAFYFAWLQHSCIKLIVPSILGIAVSFYQLFTQRWEDNEILPIFSVSFVLSHSYLSKRYNYGHRMFSHVSYFSCILVRNHGMVISCNDFMETTSK
jgi:hypothetical protein